jgi:hypothetical protein
MKSLLMVLSLFFGSQSDTTDQISAELEPSVIQLAKALKDRGGQVNLNEVSLPPRCVSGGKVLVRSALEKAFAKNSITVTDAAELSLNISIEFRASVKKDQTDVILEYSLVEGGGAKIDVKVPATATRNVRLFALLSGVPVELDPSRKGPEIDKKNNNIVEGQRQKPPSDLPPIENEDTVTVNAYSVQLLVNNTPVSIKAKGGKPFIPIEKDSSYKIRFVNKSKHDAVVEVLIDGLSMFHFAEKKDFSSIMVARESEFTIPGWFINEKKSREFVVRGVEELSGDRKKFLDLKESTGTIQFVIRQAWKEGEPSPLPDASANATDVGGDVDQDYVPVERYVGNEKVVMTIVYSKDAP